MWRFDKKRLRKRIGNWPSPVIIAVIVLVCGITGARIWYSQNLGPVSSSQQIIHFPVESGSSWRQIAAQLKADGLIRSSQAFETYVRGKNLYNKLQAGTYNLRPNMSTQTIVNKMATGDVAKNLLTILPGKRLQQIEQAFSVAGYTDAQIAVAFNPRTYDGHPALTYLPVGGTLEGLLYPDSFQKESDTPAETIVRESLDETATHLTADTVASLAAESLSPYQGITLASIVYKETGTPADEPTVAQVFLSRLSAGMPLGSDVTAYYASDIAGVAHDLSINSPYNTRIKTGLPPGPISNFSADALKAVAHPANTNYLYFVADDSCFTPGDNCVMHFSHTQAEHDQAIIQYCSKYCGQ